MNIKCTFSEKEFDMVASLVQRQIDNLEDKLNVAEATLQHKSVRALTEKIKQWEEIDYQLGNWHMTAMEQKATNEV